MNNNLSEVGFRIRKLRQERLMTQEELGNKIGKTKATINKYEIGVIKDLPRIVVQDLANALECDPGYLMLWYDKPEGPSLDSQEPTLTTEEQELIRIYRSLSGKARFALIQKAYELESN